MARYALIIGIAEYMGSFKSLETPVQNANAIADLLDRYGDFNQVKRLPFRREAGQKNLGTVIRKPLPHATLVQELQQFLQDANGSDVLLYYSGHGFTKVDPLSNTTEGFLAPSDCQVELAAGQIVAEKNGISLFGLNALIKKHTFNSLVVILDCCNSGAFLESGMVRRDVTAFGYERDYYLITACRSSSKSYEGEEYSLLTAAVLKGLSQANAAPESGRISGDRLFDVIGNELQNSRQEPIRMGWGRLITLVRYLQLPQSSEPGVRSFNPANPYMGLKPFAREQAEYFFGRQQAVRALLDRLYENRFLAVIGPSGCGKSSLVKAGLLTELERDQIPGSRDWQVKIITPGQYPLQALTNALERHQDDRPLVLFVDQFEELFTLCPNEEEQRSFIKRLNEETSDDDRQTRIIIALRGDFLDRCAKFQESADLINTAAPTTYIVIPLTEAKLVAELEESITCPAGLHGVSFEQGLVARIVDDVINQPGAMPLLQYALTQLWDLCISPNGVARQLTIQNYDAIEGVKGALQRWADQFYTNLSPNDQAFVRELISELVQLGDDGEVTRRRASWERLRELASSQEQLDRIIGQLVYQRLLVADDKTVEVAHEALLSESRLIQGWIEDNRESIRLQQRLEIYRREWEEHDRSENYLLDAGRLAAIDEWIEREQPRLTGVDQEFIGLSRERRDRQFQEQLEQERRLREEAERRAVAEIEKKLEAEARAEAEAEKVKESAARIKAEKQRTRIAITAGVLASLSLGLVLLVQYQQTKVVEQEARTVEALIGKAEQLFATHNEFEALVASINALSKLKEMGRQDQTELKRIQSIVIQIREKNRLVGHQSGVYALSFSPDEEILASGGFDGKIRLWDLEGSRALPTIQAHRDAITAVRFSPNGKLIVSSSVDKTAKVWDKQGKLIRAFSYTNSISDVDFNNDNETIAASSGNNIILWNIRLSKPSKVLIDKSLDPNKQPIRSLSFNPIRHSTLISTGSNNYDFAIWNLAQKNQTEYGEPRRVGKAISTAWSARFSLDGSMIVSTERKGLIKIWNSNSELIGVIMDNNNLTLYAEFSPDNKFIVTVGANPGVKIWSVATALEDWRKGKNALMIPIEEYKLNASSVYRARFSPIYSKNGSSKILATGGDNGLISIWSIFEEKPNDEKLIKLDELLNRSCSMLSGYSNSERLLEKSLKDCIPYRKGTAN